MSCTKEARGLGGRDDRLQLRVRRDDAPGVELVLLDVHPDRLRHLTTPFLSWLRNTQYARTSDTEKTLPSHA